MGLELSMAACDYHELWDYLYFFFSCIDGFSGKSLFSLFEEVSRWLEIGRWFFVKHISRPCLYMDGYSVVITATDGHRL